MVRYVFACKDCEKVERATSLKAGKLIERHKEHECKNFVLPKENKLSYRIAAVVEEALRWALEVEDKDE